MVLAMIASSLPSMMELQTALRPILSSDVTAQNDASVVTGMFTGIVSEDANVNAIGTITISDVDVGDNPKFPAGTTIGTYGSLNLDAAGNWTYVLDNINPTIQSLNTGQTATDTIYLTATDGTIKTITSTIFGADDFIPEYTGIDPTGTLPINDADDNSNNEQTSDSGDRDSKKISDDNDDSLGKGAADANAIIYEYQSQETDFLNLLNSKANNNRLTADDIPAIKRSDSNNASVFKALQDNINFNVNVPESTSEMVTSKIEIDAFINESFNLLDQNDLGSEELWKNIELMRSQMDVSEDGNDSEQVRIEFFATATVGFTAGFVSWILRGGSLMASFLSSVPLFNKFDPLTIAASRKKQQKNTDQSTDINQNEKVDAMFDKSGNDQ